MKPIAVILVSLVAAGAASFAVCRMSQCESPSVPAVQAPDPALTAALDRLTAQQAKLERELAELRTATPLSQPASERIPLGEIEAAVARALDARAKAAAPEVAPTASAAATPKKFEPKSAFERVRELDWDDAQAAWKEIAEAGGLDAVLAMFEANAKANPNDVEAQVALGHAYLQKLFHSNAAGPETGMWAMKADGAFDSALKLDDHNWSARFSKAMSLSHWPAVFGKQTEAIKHFEILVAQQRDMPSQSNFADTHFLLGNLYQQIGDRDRALAAWQQGLALFPENTQLAQQIANLEAH
jgi:tetratricopeptide (TPR) repeat protein